MFNLSEEQPIAEEQVATEPLLELSDELLQQVAGGPFVYNE